MRMIKVRVWTGEIVLFTLIAIIYLSYQGGGIYGGDAGDLVSAAYVGGIAHPPGYPLYVLIGNILSRLTINTVAWRVGLLSSLPMIGASVLIYRSLVLWYQRRISAFIASLSFSLAYLVWLFAEVPEVFGLYVFFVALFVYLSSLLYLSPNRKKRKLIYLLAFATGLALTHHHAILFFFPAFGYLTYRVLSGNNPYRLRRKTLFFAVGLFLLGLLPYLHVYLASRSERPVFWNRPDTLSGFFHLVSRSEYGTFVAGSFAMKDPLYRTGQVFNFLETIYFDFALLGIILIVIGGIYLFVKKRTLFYFAALAVGFGGIFFSFYASFPFTMNFVIGTYERFMLPTYLFLTIPLTAGQIFIVDRLKVFYARVLQRKKSLALIIFLSELIFVIYPLKLFYANLPKIAPLQRDRTGDELGEDILRTVPPGGIVALSDDTILFDSQYVYVTGKKWQDRAFFHLDKLAKSEHRKQLSRMYPSLTFPDDKQGGYDYLRLFIAANIDKHPFYSNDTFALSPDLTWEQMGILKRVYKKDQLPAKDVLFEENEKLWQAYHDPKTSKLAFDYHLLARDILRVYGNGRRKLGELYLENGAPGLAEKHILVAIQLEPEWWANYLFLGKLRLKQRRCNEAKEALSRVEKEVAGELETYTLMITLYEECLRVPEQVELYRQKLKRLREENQIPLNSL